MNKLQSWIVSLAFAGLVGGMSPAFSADTPNPVFDSGKLLAILAPMKRDVVTR